MLIFLIFLIFIVDLAIGQTTDNKSDITLVCENQPFRDVINELSDKTNFKFIYTDSLVDKKNISCNNKALGFNSATTQERPPMGFSRCIGKVRRNTEYLNSSPHQPLKELRKTDIKTNPNTHISEIRL